MSARPRTASQATSRPVPSPARTAPTGASGGRWTVEPSPRGAALRQDAGGSDAAAAALLLAGAARVEIDPEDLVAVLMGPLGAALQAAPAPVVVSDGLVLDLSDRLEAALWRLLVSRAPDV